MKIGELRELTHNMPDLQGEELQRWLRYKMGQMGLNPNAIYQELEMTSPRIDTHRDITYAGTPLNLHSHSFFELIYTANSCGAEYLVGAERYRLEEGDIIFVPPGVSHRPLLPDTMTEPYSRYVLWLSQEFMEYYASLYPDTFSAKQAKRSILRTKNTPWEYLGKWFLRGVQETERQEDGWEAVVLGNTIQLLTHIKRATKQTSLTPLQAEKPELLDRIADYIERHYAEEITLATLSRRFYVSSSTISHLFKERLGVSLYRYVTQRRLIAAKNDIAKGMRLDAVARKSGFQDYSAFFRVFKSTFGISPRQYRVHEDTTASHII